MSLAALACGGGGASSHQLTTTPSPHLTAPAGARTPRPRGLRGRRAVAGRAEGADRVERRAAPPPGLGDERRHVGAEGRLQAPLGHHDIVGVLRRRERVGIHEKRLRVGRLQGVDGLEQVLDGVFEVVALVDHVGRVEAGEGVAGGLREFVEDEEEAVRAQRARSSGRRRRRRSR